MIYLTTKEFAEIKGCSFQYIKKLAKNGKIKTEKEPDKHNGYKYKIPLSELPVSQQIKWYQDNKIPLPDDLVPTDNKQHSICKNLNYEELTEEQRKQVSIWIKILDDWKQFVNEYDGGKTEANKAFVDEYSDKYPVKLSVDILYRKQKIYKSGNIADLVDGRGMKRKGLNCINENLWQAFLYYYLDQAQHPVKACYDYTEKWAKQEHPELLPLPHPSTFYRHLDSDIPAPVATYARGGEKAYKDKYGFYIRREYENMYSNDYWIADNHTFDVMIGDNVTKKPKRMYLTAFMDARSGIFTGVYITDNPSSQATLYALRRGIIKYGIPKNIYVDNGREFLTFDVGGLGHRKKKSQKCQIEPPPIFQRLGINMTNAIVRNARAKTIERRFLDVKNRLSRLFDTYTGGNVLEKPERLKKILKGEIIDEIKFTQIVEDILNYNFNEQEYHGSVTSDYGKTRNEVYYEHLLEKRVATKEDLWLMMLRSTRPHKVGRRGVHITISGKRLDYVNDDLLMNWQGEQVYVRYDPEDLKSVRVYDLEDRYITTAMCSNDTVLAYGADKEDVAEAMREVRRQERIVRDSVKANKIVSLGAKNALDIVLCEVENNKCKVLPQNTAVLKIQRVKEQSYGLAVGDNEELSAKIDINKMIRNAESREKKG